MPAPISALAHALRLLKVELAQGRKEAPASQAGLEAGAASSAAQTQGVPGAVRRLPARLKALRAQGGLSRSKALRLFIEAVLLDELGGRLQLDPAFSDLVERTSAAIERDPENAKLLDDALRDLDALAE